MMDKPCCSPGWRERISAKLGACPKCMRESLLLSVGAWAVYGVADAVVPESAAVAVALAVAGAFTLLFAAHLVAFFLRAARLWRADAFPGHAAARDEPGRSRRSFLAASTALLAGMLFTPLLRIASSSPVVRESEPHPPCKTIRTVITVPKDKPIKVKSCTVAAQCVGRDAALLRLCSDPRFNECFKARDCPPENRPKRTICDNVFRGSSNVTTNCHIVRDRQGRPVSCGQGVHGEELVVCECTISVSSGADEGTVVCGCECLAP
jgi:hypothetical protein